MLLATGASGNVRRRSETCLNTACSKRWLTPRNLTCRIGEARIGPSGPVAQLGARFHGMEEVIGSIPIRSTNHFNIERKLALWCVVPRGWARLLVET